MDIANLTDEEAQAVIALYRVRHERRRYAETVADAEQRIDALGAADKARAMETLAEEPQRTEAALVEARAYLAARAEAEAQAKAAQEAAAGRKVGN